MYHLRGNWIFHLFYYFYSACIFTVHPVIHNIFSLVSTLCMQNLRQTQRTSYLSLPHPCPQFSTTKSLQRNPPSTPQVDLRCVTDHRYLRFDPKKRELSRRGKKINIYIKKIKHLQPAVISYPHAARRCSWEAAGHPAHRLQIQLTQFCLTKSNSRVSFLQV